MAEVLPISVKCQQKEQLEDWYDKEDPWKYTTTADDHARKDRIISVLKVFRENYQPFARALDLGAGEGWLTKDLPALVKHGYEISDKAASRFTDRVERKCEGTYDLVIATGVLYTHYDWWSLVKLITLHASRIVLTCNIKDWENSTAIGLIPGRQVLEFDFPYRQYVQKLRVFDVSTPQNRTTG
jgi:hypothetical protein